MLDFIEMDLNNKVSATQNITRLISYLGNELPDGIKLNSLISIPNDKQSSIKESVYPRRFEIKGFVGNIDLLRKRKLNQFIFLNNRLIKDKIVSNAIRKPYLSCIERNEYPFYVLNINMPFNSVDVNVHPNKNEVRFKTEKYLYHFIKRTITESIKDKINITSTFFGQFENGKSMPRVF